VTRGCELSGEPHEGHRRVGRHGAGRRAFLKASAKLLGACLIWAAGARAAQRGSIGGGKWIAFYGQTADEQALASYDVVILDPLFQGSIPVVGQAGATVCGYVSLGEIRMDDPYYTQVNPAALLEQNPDWPGTRRVDVRHESWKALVVDKIIPSIAARGFTGLLLDTLDTPLS
jgi:polysaccharide biosynthesis protein PelA